jgi:Fe-S oxidoreductase
LKTTAEQYLSQLLGESFVPLKDTDVCCGFAGSYSVDFPGISSGILRKKIENIKETGADMVVTDCPGCIMQIDGGVLNNDLPIKVLHLSDFLANLEIVRD